MNNLLRLFALLFLTSAFCICIHAQRATIEDFTVSGDTYKTEDECFRLTEEKDYSSGSIWYRKPISLREPFSIELTVMLGCQDEEGADGMVFVFSSRPNVTGGRGENIGFGGLVPSIGIEIDTWINYHLNDPHEDHVAFMVNGEVGHFSDVAKPIIIPNIEDCKQHKLAIRWKVDSKELIMEIDNKKVASLQRDLVSSIFRGNDQVYWGVTAATGRYNNYHEVCFDRLSFTPKTKRPFLRMPELGEVKELWAVVSAQEQLTGAEAVSRSSKQ